MRFAAVLLPLLFICHTCFSQAWGSNDLQKKHLYGKVKETVTRCNVSQNDYERDSFDIDGYLVNSTSITYRADWIIDRTSADTALYIGSQNTIYYFDDQHHLMSSIYTESSDSLVSKTEYKYNNKWQLVERAEDNRDVRAIITYVYDDKGNVIKETNDMQVKADSSVSRKQTMTFKYNDKKQRTEATTLYPPKDPVESRNVYYNVYEYFETSMEGFFAGRATMKYDGTGRVIEQNIFDHKGKPNGKITCKYDKNGNINYLMQYLSGKPFVTLITYKYDDFNNWTTKQYGKDLVYTRAITYY